MRRAAFHALQTALSLVRGAVFVVTSNPHSQIEIDSEMELEEKSLCFGCVTDMKQHGTCESLLLWLVHRQSSC
jgi:RNase P/RNase MRP subunit p30